MRRLTIYKNESAVEEIYVTGDTTNLTALANWLDDDYEGQYEMIETNDEGNPYAEVGTDYFEIKEN